MNLVERECNTCHLVKPADQFSPQGARKRKMCKKCASEKSMAYRDANVDKTFDARLRREYGITLADYDVMVKAQDGLCAICGKPPTITLGRESPRREGRRQGRPRRPQLVVDHDHETGKIRGLLCVHCNRGIGFLGDDLTTVKAAASYLEAHLEYR